MVLRLHYNEGTVRKSVRSFWWRLTGWKFLLAVSLVSGSLAHLLLIGDRSWIVGILGAVLTVSVAFASTLYMVHYRRSVGRLKRMRVPEATLELREDHFRVSSDLGATEVKWSAVAEIWFFPEVLLIFLSRAQFMTIPTADLDADARSFIESKARSHGVKVI